MIKNYKSFLIRENLNQLQLLLEGSLEYSDKFSDKLHDIKQKNRLAEVLIDLYDNYFEDDDLKYNYIDTTDKEDKITFISQKKFNQLQNKTEEELDPYSVKGRVELNVGRCVKSLLDLEGQKVSDKELEEFVNLYKSKTVTVGEEFQLVKGKYITHWYDEANQLQDWGRGSLSSSCMNLSDSTYFDIYSKSAACQLLILTKLNERGKPKLIGRALVWKPTSITTKEGEFKRAEYFMDRVYCMRDSDIQKFKDYADKNGWLTKAFNNSDNEKGMIFKLKGEVIKAKIVCKVKGDCYDYPYLDTLKYLNKAKNELSNIGYKDGYVLEDTDGGVEACDNCGGRGTADCDECGGDGLIYCGNCDGNGEVECQTCNASGGVNCESCDGEGEVACSNCEGNGEVDCGYCEGTGKSEGKRGKKVNCVHCDGKGKKRCKECKSRGTEKCPDCAGDGVIKCGDCNGGYVECSVCKGKQEVKCPECSKGNVNLCPDCTGLIDKL